MKHCEEMNGIYKKVINKLGKFPTWKGARQLKKICGKNFHLYQQVFLWHMYWQNIELASQKKEMIEEIKKLYVKEHCLKASSDDDMCYACDYNEALDDVLEHLK